MPLAKPQKTYGGTVQQKEAKERAVKKAQETAKKQFLDKYRYEGELGGLKIKDGRIAPNQDLSRYEVEYYDDGVTPKRILGEKKKYVAKKYGPQKRYDDYYGKEWEFYDDGSI